MEKATLAAMYDTHRDEFLAALRQVMAVKSVRGQQAEHAPFGSGPRAVLTAVAQLGAAYGFKTAVDYTVAACWTIKDPVWLV